MDGGIIIDWVSFFIFGYTFNIFIALCFIVIIIIIIYRSKAEDWQYFIKFSKDRSEVFLNCTLYKRILTLLLSCLPFYIGILDLIVLFNVIMKPNVNGLIEGVVKSDNFRLIRLIRYEKHE